MISGVINVPVEGPNPFAGHREPIPIEVNATAGAGGAPGAHWWQNQCGSNCTSNADCGSGEKSDCVCLAAQQSTYEPAVGVVAFVATCIISMASSGNGVVGGAGGGGKRSIDGSPAACPCNSTYVSEKCCEVNDGMVWEGREFKLGELVR